MKKEYVLKIVFLVAILTLTFPLLDVHAKGGGKGGEGMGKAGKNSGNTNQQRKGNGQRVKDGSCVNNNGQGQGSGKQMMNESNNMGPKGAAGGRSK